MCDIFSVRQGSEKEPGITELHLDSTAMYTGTNSKNCMAVPKKIKNGTPTGSSSPTSGCMRAVRKVPAINTSNFL